jgi:CO/xanthine dehydrogenase FAD-binding subunit
MVRILLKARELKKYNRSVIITVKTRETLVYIRRGRMFTLTDLVQPDTLEEAYQALINKRNNTVFGGCAFLRLGSQRIGTAVDLSKLKLNYITEQAGYVEIGAMTTFRDLETNAALKEYFNGIVPKAVGNIIGVQFRNIVTVGGTVFSKYGFSDLITALVVLDTEVELYKGGRMSLVDFLEKPYEKDILTKVLIKKNERKAVYQNFRISASDYPVLTVAVSHLNQEWVIAVGARPHRAKIADRASQALSGRALSQYDIEQAAGLAMEELAFGSNTRGTAKYRQEIGKVLVRRAITEALQCR